VLAPCEIEGTYARELEGQDNEAPLGIDFVVREHVGIGKAFLSLLHARVP